MLFLLSMGKKHQLNNRFRLVSGSQLFSCPRSSTCPSPFTSALRSTVNNLLPTVGDVSEVLYGSFEYWVLRWRVAREMY